MTIEEIRKLPAGIEIDTLTAIMVMDWKVYTPEEGLHDGNTARPHCLRMPQPDGRESLFVFGKGSEDRWWSPSRDIAAAFEVVQRMAEASPLGPEFELIWIPELEGFSWRAVFGNSIFPHCEIHSCGPTAPLAICRAALAVFIAAMTPVSLLCLRSDCGTEHNSSDHAPGCRFRCRCGQSLIWIYTVNGLRLMQSFWIPREKEVSLTHEVDT